MEPPRLSTVVRGFRETARRIKLACPPRDLLRDAYTLASTHCGKEIARAQAATSCIAAIALSLDQLVVHQLRKDLVQLVNETDLHSLPHEPPRFLRRAFIVEAHHPEQGERLFGDTAAIACFPYHDEMRLVGAEFDGAMRVSVWKPVWTGGELEAGMSAASSPLIDDAEVHHDWTLQAARLAIVLGLLLDAEGAPIGVTDESSRSKESSQHKGRPPPAWVTRYVYVRAKAVHASTREIEASAGGIEGRDATSRPVRGHLKRQRFGPGHKELRWIYVESYEARRWVAPRDVRVVIGR